MPKSPQVCDIDAVAAQVVRDVGALITRAAKARKRVSTFAIDGRVRFASAADRAAFARELAEAVAALAGQYHDETAPGGREHRLVVAVYPGVHAQARANEATEAQAEEL
jgi:hypothetical protein